MRQLDPSTGLIVVGDLAPNLHSVTMRSARLALRRRGLLKQVDDALNAMPDGEEKEDALIEWNFAGTVDRDSNMTKTVAAILQLNDEQLDELFAYAASLQSQS